MTTGRSKATSIALLLLAGALLGGCTAASRDHGGKSGWLVVGAATSVSGVMPDLVEEFAKTYPRSTVRVNYAASGVLLQQAQRGAEIDLFLFADAFTVQQAASMGIELSHVTTVARNSLVLIVPEGNREEVNVMSDLLSTRIRTVCIGNPEYVPLGRYAKRALEAAGLFESLQDKLLLAGSAAQVRQYLNRGEVDAAIVYGTDARLLDPGSRVVAELNETPAPEYMTAVMSGSVKSEGAVTFTAFLASAKAREIFSNYGFIPAVR